MAYRTETRISSEAMPETVNLFDVAAKIQPEKLDMAGGLAAHQQAERPHTST